jgi:hypothetical protein
MLFFSVRRSGQPLFCCLQVIVARVLSLLRTRGMHCKPDCRQKCAKPCMTEGIGRSTPSHHRLGSPVDGSADPPLASLATVATDTVCDGSADPWLTRLAASANRARGPSESSSKSESESVERLSVVGLFCLFLVMLVNILCIAELRSFYALREDFERHTGRCDTGIPLPLH